MRRLLALALLATACADPPREIADGPTPKIALDDADLDTGSPEALRAGLHALIDDHRRITYNRRRGTDTWVMLEEADAEPGRPGWLRDLYRHRLQRALGGGFGDYDREHVWPKSYGFPDDHAGNYPYTDGHGLYIADSSYNRSRGNRPFGWCEAFDCEARPTEGGEGTNFIDDARGADGVWEVWAARRGDVARAMFYMDVRYEGGWHGVTGRSEPDLILTDDRALIAASNTRENIDVAYMGLRSALLEWHRLDPPDDLERARNDAIERYQGNRNPFVDRPEWVECVFVGVCDAAPGGDGLWISELHYDNVGADAGEFVEVAGPAGADLSGWRLVGYNGRDGGQYTAVDLDGRLPDEGDGRGARAFPIRGLQNGGADGVALVDPDGEVREFWSYEGRLTAVDGPATGLLSDDIGVAESGDTPEGHAVGRDAPDAEWRGPRPATPGWLN